MTIVPDLQVLKNGGASQGTRRKWAGHALGFEGDKETLHDGVVVAVAHPAHGELGQDRIQAGQIGGGGVLAALVRVVQQPGG